ncbi:unnamed protein product [Litomosoides sigmodontis]|uniref:Uncharacterized protein n=1 Tax=Litomosoides sigmodontis TaxID=42156 RepID=A0A3P6SRN6_LITSI|nr:unnamed protein product [Litomosoides sigmodontis]
MPLFLPLLVVHKSSKLPSLYLILMRISQNGKYYDLGIACVDSFRIFRDRHGYFHSKTGCRPRGRHLFSPAYPCVKCGSLVIPGILI